MGEVKDNCIIKCRNAWRGTDVISHSASLLFRQIDAVSLFLLYLVEMICSGLQIIYNTDEVTQTPQRPQWDQFEGFRRCPVYLTLDLLIQLQPLSTLNSQQLLNLQVRSSPSLSVFPHQWERKDRKVDTWVVLHANELQVVDVLFNRMLVRLSGSIIIGWLMVVPSAGNDPPTSHTAFIKLMLRFLMSYLRMSAPNPPTLSDLSVPFLVGFFFCNTSLLDETPSVNHHHRRSGAEINSFSLRSFTTVSCQIHPEATLLV